VNLAWLAVWLLVGLAFWSVVGYVIVHFILKFW
jgi:hypothetical protein